MDIKVRNAAHVRDEKWVQTPDAQKSNADSAEPLTCVVGGIQVIFKVMRAVVLGISCKVRSYSMHQIQSNPF